ncbi:MAG: NAD-dependent epimerase/dehydratase family protein [Gammaproteobacteria bacterium]|nr:MAG: NAD-dependent epimerase/dehydratase family protein [Gammaproteobacteria bacterium]
MANQFKQILVTGGAGYVGSRLVPALLENGYKVKVLDLYIYDKEIFKDYKNNSALTEIQGDIRDTGVVHKAMEGCDAVIHLACISNDPSFDLDPTLGKSINYDAFRPMVKMAKELGVKRFIYASSSSVYGIKEEQNVTEDLELNPLTDYSKYKAECEKVLAEEAVDGFETVTIRPATVCGYAPRQRLDLTVNILTAHAWKNKVIKVFGGNQLRPNIHIDDMVTVYLTCLAAAREQIDRKIFNAGYQNHSVADIANMVKNVFSEEIAIEVVPTDDNRSYHISSQKIEAELGFKPKYTIEDAARGLKQAFDKGLLSNPLTTEKYHNIKQMQKIGLT